MCMKGLQTSLNVVIAAIVILIVALVLLTIFGVGITPVRTITGAVANCDAVGAASCLTVGSLPATWSSQSFLVDGAMKACSSPEIKSCSTCSGCGYEIGAQAANNPPPVPSAFG